VALGPGDDHTCAVLAGGEVHCWGRNHARQLADTTYVDLLSPKHLSSVAPSSAASGSGATTCALTTAGGVQCWGATYGATPTTIASLSDVRQLDVALRHRCAVTGSGQVQCWGNNSHGQLGDGSTSDRTVVAPVTGISDAQRVATGSEHSCAVRGAGTVSCWGAAGTLGDGSSAESSLPVAVTAITDAISIAAGVAHTCVVRGSGVVRCWGENDNGQLGDGTTTDRPAPVAVGGIDAAVEVATSGGRHTCALLEGGTVSCWGRNSSHQLGDGSTPHAQCGLFSCSAVPVPVPGVTDAVAIRAGESSTCALRPGGLALCWGANVHGQLGDGFAWASKVPVTVRAVEVTP
jgi:alpha-tubulin suppressor-like RCC1 family protein